MFYNYIRWTKKHNMTWQTTVWEAWIFHNLLELKIGISHLIRRVLWGLILNRRWRNDGVHLAIPTWRHPTQLISTSPFLLFFKPGSFGIFSGPTLGKVSFCRFVTRIQIGFVRGESWEVSERGSLKCVRVHKLSNDQITWSSPKNASATQETRESMYVGSDVIWHRMKVSW